MHFTQEIKEDCVMQRRCNGKATFVGCHSTDFNQQHVHMWSHLSSRRQPFYAEGNKEETTKGTLHTVCRDYRTKKLYLNAMKSKI